MPLTPDPQPNPSAAVLIIGDEILSGRTLDTNVGTLARFLSPLGIDLCEVRMVPDEEGRIITALNALRTAYDYVFTTGGGYNNAITGNNEHEFFKFICRKTRFGVAAVDLGHRAAYVRIFCIVFPNRGGRGRRDLFNFRVFYNLHTYTSR